MRLFTEAYQGLYRFFDNFIAQPELGGTPWSVCKILGQSQRLDQPYEKLRMARFLPGCHHARVYVAANMIWHVIVPQMNDICAMVSDMKTIKCPP